MLVQQFDDPETFFLYGSIAITSCASIGYLASLLIPPAESPADYLTLYTFTGHE
jgi:hypothetical protein